MENKTLVLDYSKWRSGSDGENKVGEGTTQLLNNEGFMCCLGLFACQLKKEIGTNPDIIKGFGEPNEVGTEITLLAWKDTDWEEGEEVDSYHNSSIVEPAIEINDDSNTTPEYKIEELKKLFSKHGYDIEVINKPVTN